MRRWAALVIIWGLGAVSGSMVGWTSAIFTSTTSNPGNNFAAAASFCPTPSTATAATDRDSWVQEDSGGNDNHGTETTLNVQSRTGQARRTLIYFPLPSKPGGCVVSSAILRLYATSADSGRTIEARRIQATWTETGVIWNNQPAADSTPVATSSSGTAPAWKEWNVTSLVDLMYSGSNHGFQLKDAAETGGSSLLQVYQSEEGTTNTQDPQLVVTFSDQVCSSPGTQTVLTDRDADVRENTPTNNTGTATTLSVQSLNAARNRRALVYFPLDTVPVPANCTLTLATLRLNASTADPSRTIEAYQAAGAWTETLVNWNNKPATTGTPATTTSGTGWKEWTVTAQVDAMYAGTNDGFVVRDQTEDAGVAETQTYSSREGANGPALVVRFG